MAWEPNGSLQNAISLISKIALFCIFVIRLELLFHSRIIFNARILSANGKKPLRLVEVPKSFGEFRNPSGLWNEKFEYDFPEMLDSRKLGNDGARPKNSNGKFDFERLKHRFKLICRSCLLHLNSWLFLQCNEQKCSSASETLDFHKSILNLRLKLGKKHKNNKSRKKNAFRHCFRQSSPTSGSRNTSLSRRSVVKVWCFRLSR